LVVGASGSVACRRRSRRFIGLTMKKNRAAPTSRKLTSAFRNLPYVIVEPLTVTAMAEKSAEKMMPIRGVSRSATSELTMAVNAAPMTIPTARSTTLPRRMKLRNSPSIGGG
jgi:hypothetical protein